MRATNIATDTAKDVSQEGWDGAAATEELNIWWRRIFCRVFHGWKKQKDQDWEKQNTLVIEEGPEETNNWH